ncbi:quinol oxidase [Streptococcus suis]|uniref:quinol oxidase n=1 Tax=Streptococcus suis TaxID=1307 RepID=UPI000CF5C3E4|nr:quinol oxidase [Streptococcus suis]HEM6309933.1 quinol oxidase [Streptococcus suis]
MTELDAAVRETSTKPRRHRRARRSKSYQIAEEFKDKLPQAKIWPALIWSLVLSLVSVANPYLTFLATNLQTQNLYAGMAMMSGQHPYGDFFATNGILFYLMSLIGHIGGSFIVFGFLQFIALVIAGVYFYKIMVYFSQSERLATSSSHWFYIFIASLGFGGLYAEVFVLPFVLASLWFLVRYFANAVGDEAFILYGIEAALAFLIYPQSLLLWLLAGFILFVFNTQQRQMARGFYQLLASIFGLLLILYSVGYYAFEAEILGTAIQQTLIYNLRLEFLPTEGVTTLAMFSAFLLFSGFLKNIFQTLLSIGRGGNNYFKVLILLIFLTQSIFIIGTPNFQWSQLLLLLPFGFIMAVLPMQDSSEEDKEDGYLGRQFFLPVVVALGIVIQPAYTYLVQGDLLAERIDIAQYIRENSDSNDKIFTWDNSASIYLSSRRLSSASIVATEPFLITDENQRSLIFDLNRNEASFIVVNKGIPLSDELASNLELQYKQVKSYDHFVIYQKNE